MQFPRDIPKESTIRGCKQAKGRAWLSGVHPVKAQGSGNSANFHLRLVGYRQASAMISTEPKFCSMTSIAPIFPAGYSELEAAFDIDSSFLGKRGLSLLRI